jgi:hypothetical protein
MQLHATPCAHATPHWHPMREMPMQTASVDPKTSLARGAPAIPAASPDIRIPSADTHKAYTDLSTPQLTNMAISLMLEYISVTRQPQKLKACFISAGGTDAMMIGRAAAVRGTGLQGFRNAGLNDKLNGVRKALKERDAEPEICSTLRKMLLQTKYPNSGRGLRPPATQKPRNPETQKVTVMLANEMLAFHCDA